jgi:hypothetical protein
LAKPGAKTTRRGLIPSLGKFRVFDTWFHNPEGKVDTVPISLRVYSAKYEMIFFNNRPYIEIKNRLHGGVQKAPK